MDIKEAFDICKEIAQDKDIVKDLKESLKNGTLLNWCPFSKRVCKEVCHRLWPGSYSCPCGKPNREEFARLIISLEGTSEEKFYKRGDIFMLNNEKDPYMLCWIDEFKCSLISLQNGNRWHDPVVVEKEIKTDRIPFSIVKLCAYDTSFTHIGHISNMITKEEK